MLKPKVVERERLWRSPGTVVDGVEGLRLVEKADAAILYCVEELNELDYCWSCLGGARNLGNHWILYTTEKRGICCWGFDALDETYDNNFIFFFHFNFEFLLPCVINFIIKFDLLVYFLSSKIRDHCHNKFISM